MELLSIKGVSKNFRGLRALDKVNIDVPKGHIFGLIGPNGSGKTTLLNVITAFIRPTEGQVLYKGEPITGLKPHAVTRRGIARTFQLASVYPNLTVEENIIVGRHLKIRSGTLGSFFHTPSYRLEQSKLRQKARELMALLEVEERRDVIAKNLAFGDERKLEIAIALASEPELLLMDEPAAGMNPDEQLRLMRFVRAMTAEFGITVVIIEHNMRVIMGLCRSIAVLDYGVKVAEGTPDEIANNEKVISAYLGQSQLD